MNRILFVFLFVLSTTACASDETCKALAKQVLTLKGSDPTVYGVPPCKPMPDDPGKTIMILDNEILVVRSDSGKIVSHGGFGTTPVGSTPDSIDTAPYWLTPTIRGFGIRFDQYFPHYHAGESHQTLNMYVMEGENIRPVMELLIVHLEISGEPYRQTNNEPCDDETPESDCTRSTVTYDSTISMAKTRHHGYADMIVTRHDDSGKLVHDRFHYDAGHYVGNPEALEDPVSPVQ